MASTDDQQRGSIDDAVNTYSSPSDLKITDLRYAVVWSNYDYPIIRIDNLNSDQKPFKLSKLNKISSRFRRLQDA